MALRGTQRASRRRLDVVISKNTLIPDEKR